MEEKVVMQAEETSAVSETAPEETAQGWNDEDFLEGFTEEPKETAEDAEENTEEQADKVAQETAEEAQKQPEKISVDGREFSAEDVGGLLARITELQAAANQKSSERDFVERIAALSGMDAETFMREGAKMIVSRQADARAAQLMEQGIPEDMARHFAQIEAENQAAKNADKVRGQQAEAEQAAKETTDAQIRANVEEFARMFPDVKELPDEVIEDIEKTGRTPVVCYQEFLLRQKEKEIAAMRQDQKNRKNTTGSVKGTPKGEKDPFLSGFSEGMR